jgi:hypothetical protein
LFSPTIFPLRLLSSSEFLPAYNFPPFPTFFLQRLSPLLQLSSSSEVPSPTTHPPDSNQGWFLQRTISTTFERHHITPGNYHQSFNKDSPKMSACGSNPANRNMDLSNNLVVVDPDGDLILRTPTKSFKVCSSAMRRASPVMKAMLFGPWKEAKPADETQPWIVDLPEDDPEALGIVLPVIHNTMYDQDDLFRIDIRHMPHILNLVKKYLIPFKPFIKGWIEVHERYGWGIDDDHDPGTEFLSDLEAAWELGLIDAVVWILTHVLHHGKTKDTNKLASKRFFKQHPHLLRMSPHTR